MRSRLNLAGLVSTDPLPNQGRPSFPGRLRGRVRRLIRKKARKRAVITGVGVVSPLGIGVEDFWEGLQEGRTGMDRITRFDATEFPCQVAAEVTDDSYLEHLNEREKEYYARATRYAVAAFDMARIDAGIDHFDEHRTGVILGSAASSMDYMEEQIERHPGFLRGFKQGTVDPFVMVKSFIAAPSAAVALSAGCRGYVTSVSTACTSGVNAVGLAAERINNGQADIVIAGGVDTPINRILLNAFCAANYFTTDNSHPDTCLKPFDLNRTKCALGEGAAIFIIEDREHAIARGARVYAEVESFHQETENGNELFFFDQSGDRWADTMRGAVDKVSGNIDHINAHGTSDKVADKIEVTAIRKALGKRADASSITSIKSSTGSGLAAAGVFQVAAALMSLFTGKVPGIVNYETPDPDLGRLKFLKRSHNEELERILVNSKGFGGFNTALLLRRFAL